MTIFVIFCTVLADTKRHLRPWPQQDSGPQLPSVTWALPSPGSLGIWGTMSLPPFCCPIISCFFFSAGISHKHLVHMLCMLHSEMAVVLRRLPRTVCLRGMFVLCKPHLSSFQWARLGAVPAGEEMRACDGMKNLSAPLHWLLDSWDFRWQ